MPFLHQLKDFKTLLEQSSKMIGLAFPVVEKDYWVTFILKTLVNSEFSEEFLFKGGTSLSKIWFEDFGRFSEDIDILLLPTDKAQKRRDQTKRLKEFIEFVNKIEGLEFDEENSDSLESNIIGGKFYFNYPSINGSTNIEGMKPKILIEPGYRGGSVPSTKKEMNSFVNELICKQYKGTLPEEYLECAPFEITSLNPERILLEKLDAILNLHSRGKLKSGTRHFYDIHKLIKLDCIKDLNSDIINPILEDINKISKEFYGNKNPLTIERIKLSEVFSRQFSGLSILEAQYKSENQLYYNKQPSFESMLEDINTFVQCL